MSPDDQTPQCWLPFTCEERWGVLAFLVSVLFIILYHFFWVANTFLVFLLAATYGFYVHRQAMRTVEVSPLALKQVKLEMKLNAELERRDAELEKRFKTKLNAIIVKLERKVRELTVQRKSASRLRAEDCVQALVDGFTLGPVIASFLPGAESIQHERTYTRAMRGCRPELGINPVRVEEPPARTPPVPVATPLCPLVPDGQAQDVMAMRKPLVTLLAADAASLADSEPSRYESLGMQMNNMTEQNIIIQANHELAEPCDIDDYNYADRDILTKVLADPPSMLHISCPGGYNEDGAFMALDCDETDFVSEDDLHRLLTELPIGLGRVVAAMLSSSYSYDLHTCLLEAGVKHVVCIKGAVRDATRHLFTEAFYRSVFEGCSVREAFDSAQQAVARVPLFSKFKTVTFTNPWAPNPSWESPLGDIIGMEYGAWLRDEETKSWKCQVTKVVDGSQADLMGVEEDWWIVRIDKRKLDHKDTAINEILCQSKLNARQHGIEVVFLRTTDEGRQFHLKTLLGQDQCCAGTVCDHLPRHATAANVVVPDTLPVLKEPFVGREELIERCIDLVKRGNHVVITGKKRIGKTELGKQALYRILRQEQRPVYYLKMRDLSRRTFKTICRYVETWRQEPSDRRGELPILFLDGQTSDDTSLGFLRKAAQIANGGTAQLIVTLNPAASCEVLAVLEEICNDRIETITVERFDRHDPNDVAALLRMAKASYPSAGMGALEWLATKLCETVQYRPDRMKTLMCEVNRAGRAEVVGH